MIKFPKSLKFNYTPVWNSHLYAHSQKVTVKDDLDSWGKNAGIGLAEHAVRTHAAVAPFDRRGDIHAWDDFESATKRYNEFAAGAGTIARSTDTAKFGSYSLKMVTDVGVGAACRIEYPQLDYHDGLLGSSISLACANTTYNINWNGYCYDGTKEYIAAIKWIQSTGKLSYWGSDSAFHEISGTYDMYADIHAWATLKIVVDTVEHEYVRALFLNNEIDLADIAVAESADATKRNFNSMFQIAAAENAAKTCYFDNFVFTVNEPV